jgi:rhamnogalacturonyl hydrolase YesR
VAGRSAADYWIRTTGSNLGNNGWENLALHSGVMALYKATGATAYRDFTLRWANKHSFGLRTSSSNPHFADDQAAGQAYLDLYADNPDPKRIAAVTKEIDATIATGKTDYWWWVDALHMAMPLYARLGGSARTEYVHRLYTWTKTREGGGGLWNPTKGLWWRDKKFVNRNVYWSRGNGWAIAALTKVLDALPANDSHRAEYVADFRKMAAALAPVQRPDGFWNVNLGNPNEFPGPETSGTAFFTYGLAWGVNKGVLDAATYRPIAKKAWDGLVRTALQPSGKVGYVQGVGQQPSDNQPVTSASTTSFGVGAFLLASSQMATL